MADLHAVFLYNHVPDPSSGLSPSDVFTKARWPQKRFHDLHVFQSPAYILDKTIQDGKKIPHWKPRSKRCQFMGFSGSHATSAPLVLNTSTGSITPQFHVVFDDWFATVASSIANLPDFNSPMWQKMFGDSDFQYLDDEETPLADDSPFTDRSNRVTEAVETSSPPQPLEVVPSPYTPPTPLGMPQLPTTPSPVRHLEFLRSDPTPMATPTDFVPHPSPMSSPCLPTPVPVQQRESSAQGQQREKTVKQKLTNLFFTKFIDQATSCSETNTSHHLHSQGRSTSKLSCT